MADIFTKKKRSWIMSRIRGKGTTVERIFEKELRASKLKFKSHPRILERGNPDFIVGKTAIFIDGCFWHKCPKHYRAPKSRKSYWLPKIEQNVKRDREVNRELKKMGYNVIRFWEHDVNNRPERCIVKVKSSITGSGGKYKHNR